MERRDTFLKCPTPLCARDAQPECMIGAPLQQANLKCLRSPNLERPNRAELGVSGSVWLAADCPTTSIFQSSSQH